MPSPTDVHDALHFDRLVKKSEKVVAWFYFGPEGAEETSPPARDAPANVSSNFTELANRLTSVTSCRVDLSAHPELRGMIGESLSNEREIDAGQSTEKHACWVIFKDSVKVWTAPASTPWPRVSRLIGLLEGNPDTFDQMARQQDFSRKIQDPAPRGDSGPTGATAEGRSTEQSPEQAEASETAQGSRESPALVFVGGDRSQVGKSSTCLGLLGSFLREGLRTSDLAYIKPATQCEKPQLVTEWCERAGVACQGIGPVVFYKGFTREFLKGGAGTSADLLGEIQDAVRDIARGKKVVVVDGVGYPAVGSICGVSNGEVAAALKAPVLLVGKSGVGDAVDSFNLNACFFEARGVRVLGGIFNRISTTGYYSIERCREAVNSYFRQAKPQAMPYGFVPEIPSLKPRPVQSDATTSAASPQARPEAETPAVSASTSGGERAGSKGEDTTGEAEKAPLPPVTAVESEGDLRALLEAVGSDRLVLVDFSAGWCKNCKAVEPFVHELPQSFEGAVAVATVDVDAAEELAEAHDVTSLPHFILFKSGVQVDAYTGSSQTELMDMLRRATGAGQGSLTSSLHQPQQQQDETAEKETPPGDDSESDEVHHRLEAAHALIEAFSSHVDLPRLLSDILQHAGAQHVERAAPTDGAIESMAEQAEGVNISTSTGTAERSPAGDASAPRKATRTREEIEADATKEGASGG